MRCDAVNVKSKICIPWEISIWMRMEKSLGIATVVFRSIWRKANFQLLRTIYDYTSKRISQSVSKKLLEALHLRCECLLCHDLPSNTTLISYFVHLHVSEILLTMQMLRQGGLIAFPDSWSKETRMRAASLSRLRNSRCKTVLKDLQCEIGTKYRSLAITYLF